MKEECEKLMQKAKVSSSKHDSASMFRLQTKVQAAEAVVEAQKLSDDPIKFLERVVGFKPTIYQVVSRESVYCCSPVSASQANHG
jgi:hypothetical protein